MPISNPTLDDGTFETLLDYARKKISVYSKNWTNYNESDPGITFLELFCWLADNQIYSLNRISKKNYLKFLKLLGQTPRKSYPAKLNVSFTCNKEIQIQKNTQLHSSAHDITFETENPLSIIPVNIQKVLTSSFLELHDESKLLEKKFIYGFGKVPKIGHAFLLGLSGKYAKKATLDIDIQLEHDDNDLDEYFVDECWKDNKFHPSCKIQWKYLKSVGDDVTPNDFETLEIISDTTFSLTKSGIVSLSIPFDKMSKTDLDSSGQVLSWISCTLSDGQYEIPPKIKSIKLNSVSAIQGCTITEFLGTSTGLADQSFALSKNPLITVINTEIKEPKTKVQSFASYMWIQVDDFDASGPDDKHYTVDIDTGAINFGNGINGDIPHSESQIISTYRYGSIQNDLDVENLQLTVSDEKKESELDKLDYSLSYGGRQAETIEESIQRVRHQLRLASKAVSASDYEYIVKHTPGVKVDRIATIPDPKNNAVTVVVVPYSTLDNPVPSNGFLQNVYEYLNRHRILTTQINVTGPNYIQISVSMDVQIQADVNPSKVHKKIVSVLNEFLCPMSNNNNKGWQFGRPVHRSEIYSVIKNIEGIAYVTKPYLQANGKRDTFRYESGKIWIDKTSIVFPGDHSINTSTFRQSVKNRGSNGK